MPFYKTFAKFKGWVMHTWKVRLFAAVSVRRPCCQQLSQVWVELNLAARFSPSRSPDRLGYATCCNKKHATNSHVSVVVFLIALPRSLCFNFVSLSVSRIIQTVVNKFYCGICYWQQTILFWCWCGSWSGSRNI